MENSNTNKKYLIIHAHFYQPPRENPWTGIVDMEPSAWPYHDWNEKIARECYIPNSMARISDPLARIVDVANNYEHLNFNFGPTLFAWLQKAFPDYYEKIIKTAGKTKQIIGYSNAIAQSYNHIIMPLANFQDQVTQILWGLYDFEQRFGFKPEAMWLPETAVNDDTLRLLIDHGMKYVLLSPMQAEKIKVIGTEEWTDVFNGSIDPKKPYVWFDADSKGNIIKDRKIAVFFYDFNLSQAVAFKDVLINSATFIEHVLGCYENSLTEDQLVCIATDGETYGHHHKFGDMTLAHSFRHELKKHGIESTNFSLYLQKHPPEYEVKIKTGIDEQGTSWSCSHGMRRWKGGCDCGREGNFQLEWRMPLRSALNWLRDVLMEIYKEQGDSVFRNIWTARNNYIKIMLDRNDKTLDKFWTENCKENLSKEEKTKALLLLELQKNSMYMFTSCGWFFSDISRIETVQNLKYAACAIEIAEKLGYKGIERGFTGLLEMAPSNFKEFPDGKRIYEKLVKPHSTSIENMLAIYLIFYFKFNNRMDFYPDYEFQIEEIPLNPPLQNGEINSQRQSRIDSNQLAVGIIKAKNVRVGETLNCLFVLTGLENELPEVYVFSNDIDSGLQKIKNLLSDETIKTSENIKVKITEIVDKKPFELNDLPMAEKLKILLFLWNANMEKNKSAYEQLLKEHLAIIKNFDCFDSRLLGDLREGLKIFAENVIYLKLKEFLKTQSDEILNDIYLISMELSRQNLNINGTLTEGLVSDEISRFLNEFKKDKLLNSVTNRTATMLHSLPPATKKANSNSPATILKIIKLVKALNLNDAIYFCQNEIIEILYDETEKMDFLSQSETGREILEELNISIKTESRMM